MGRGLLLQVIVAGLCDVIPAAQTTTAGSRCPLAAIAQRSSAAETVSVSANGRFVAFASRVRLVPSDRDSQSDIYVLDLGTGAVTLESVFADTAISGDSQRPSISGDGRLLVFESSRPLPGAIGGDVHPQIILRDRHNGTMRMLTAGHDSRAGNGTSSNPIISSDGRVVTFESAATNLSPGTDANGSAYDVYVVVLETGVTVRASVDDQGRQSPLGFSISPTISADGRYVAFTSTALLDGSPPSSLGRSRRHPTQMSSPTQVFLRDLERGVTRLVSATTRGRPANKASYSPSMSGDGRWIGFVSEATNLTPGDRNDVADVYLREIESSATILVSGASGRSADGPSTRPALSRTGRFVAFQSEASDLVCGRHCRPPDDDVNLVLDVFLFDRDTRGIERLSADADGGWMESSGLSGMDAEGRVVVFSSRHPTDEHDLGNTFDFFVWRSCNLAHSGEDF